MSTYSLRTDLERSCLKGKRQPRLGRAWLKVKQGPIQTATTESCGRFLIQAAVQLVLYGEPSALTYELFETPD